MRLITLLTDFGMKDWFVGAMKGVILSLQPRATVVDITHEIPTGDVRAGAFALAASYWLFPRGTIHLAVVDPGVGSQRKAIAVRTTDYVFLGPDNGVLSWALARQKVRAIHALENEHYFLRNVSRTFHGRDIFSPVAAHLSRGVSIKRLGPPLLDFQRLEWPEPRQRKGRIEGQVVYIDRFGNAINEHCRWCSANFGGGHGHGPASWQSAVSRGAFLPSRRTRAGRGGTWLLRGTGDRHQWRQRGSTARLAR